MAEDDSHSLSHSHLSSDPAQPLDSGGAGAGGTSATGLKRRRRLADLTQDEVNEIVALRGKLPQAVVGKKYGIEQTDVSHIQRLGKAKSAKSADEKKPGFKRVRDLEMVLPIAYGTIAFWLGKKADEYHSHKWTVYVRGAANEDVSPVVRRVVFTLHDSFKNPIRTVDRPPFEVTETGWGEFDIGITIFFHPDASEKPVEIYHALKLYPDADRENSSTKKPVVSEAYDEVVFCEPSEQFFNATWHCPAIQLSGSEAVIAAATAAAPPAHPAPPQDGAGDKRARGDTKEHALVAWFGVHTDEYELAGLRAARETVAAHMSKLERDYAEAEAECQRIKTTLGAGALPIQL